MSSNLAKTLARLAAPLTIAAVLGCHHAGRRPLGGVPCDDPYATAAPGPMVAEAACFPACETGAACDVCGDDHPPYADEWICDGGDVRPDLRVNAHGAELGLNLEDAAAIYDSADLPGERLVAPSNRECIYAPRFAAVRKVYTPIAEHGNLQAVGMQMDDPALLEEAVDPIYVAALDDPIGDFTVPTPPAIDHGAQLAGAASTATALLIAEERLGPVVRLGFVRTGVYTGDERLLIEEFMQAAETWTHDAAVQVVVSGEAASEVVGDRRVQQLHLFEHEGETAIRVCKLATPKTAQRGDVVEFTIRFDNVSDQIARNVEIVDNLTTRLQYVEATQQSSLPAEFSTQPNDGDSLVLRWSLAEPLAPGEGGSVTFRCKVL